MELTRAARQILDELKLVLDYITVADYARPIPVLNDSTIGQHVRHILEFFICLSDGYFKGLVNYDKRKRDRGIEQDQQSAITAVRKILDSMKMTHLEHDLILEMNYDSSGEEIVRVLTNYQRELAYNIEHAVHHMALIRIGVQAIAPYVRLSKEFGVAVSTVRHRENFSNSITH